MSDIDQDGDGGTPQGKPLGRGLEDISHLFLSQRTEKLPVNDRPPAPPAKNGVTLLKPASVTKEWLTTVLTEFGDALEDGLRTIDVNVSCYPCGEIDVLAVDRASRLAIVDFDAATSDDLLLRGLGHFDWLVHNMPNVRRMYREQNINVALQPRLFLLAPQFSSRISCAA